MCQAALHNSTIIMGYGEELRYAKQFGALDSTA